MNWSDNCYDNDHAESFWNRLKTELLYGDSIPGLAESRLQISHNIANCNA